MTGPASGDGAPDDDVRAPLPERVRRRLDDVFGDVLPEITRDEAADAPGGTASPREDDWLRANRPPHHDRD